jgi:hypothetical protein
MLRRLSAKKKGKSGVDQTEALFDPNQPVSDIIHAGVLLYGQAVNHRDAAFKVRTLPLKMANPAAYISDIFMHAPQIAAHLAKHSEDEVFRFIIGHSDILTSFEIIKH